MHMITAEFAPGSTHSVDEATGETQGFTNTDEILEAQPGREQVSIDSATIPLSFDVVAPDYTLEIADIADELYRFSKAASRIIEELDPDFVSVSNLPSQEVPRSMGGKTQLYFDLLGVNTDITKIAPVLPRGYPDFNMQVYAHQHVNTVITAEDASANAEELEHYRDNGTISRYGVHIPSELFSLIPTTVERIIKPADFALTWPLNGVVSYEMMLNDMASNGVETPIIPTLQFPLDEDPQSNIEGLTKVATGLIQAGAPGIHFLTRNDVEPVAQVVQHLRAA